MSNTQEKYLLQLYKKETGVTDIVMHDVAVWAEKRGWKMPKPVTAVELLARRLARAAREQTRKDAKSGMPYHSNHAYKAPRDGETTTYWVDIDENPPRPIVERSAKNRRDQMKRIDAAVDPKTLFMEPGQTSRRTDRPTVGFGADVDGGLTIHRKKRKVR